MAGALSGSSLASPSELDGGLGMWPSSSDQLVEGASRQTTLWSSPRTGSGMHRVNRKGGEGLSEWQDFADMLSMHGSKEKECSGVHPEGTRYVRLKFVHQGDLEWRRRAAQEGCVQCYTSEVAYVKQIQAETIVLSSQSILQGAVWDDGFSGAIIRQQATGETIQISIGSAQDSEDWLRRARAVAVAYDEDSSGDSHDALLEQAQPVAKSTYIYRVQLADVLALEETREVDFQESPPLKTQVPHRQRHSEPITGGAAFRPHSARPSVRTEADTRRSGSVTVRSREAFTDTSNTSMAPHASGDPKAPVASKQMRKGSQGRMEEGQYRQVKSRHQGTGAKSRCEALYADAQHRLEKRVKASLASAVSQPSPEDTTAFNPPTINPVDVNTFLARQQKAAAARDARVAALAQEVEKGRASQLTFSPRLPHYKTNRRRLPNFLSQMQREEVRRQLRLRLLHAAVEADSTTQRQRRSSAKRGSSGDIFERLYKTNLAPKAKRDDDKCKPQSEVGAKVSLTGAAKQKKIEVSDNTGSKDVKTSAKDAVDVVGISNAVAVEDESNTRNTTAQQGEARSSECRAPIESVLYADAEARRERLRLLQRQHEIIEAASIESGKQPITKGVSEDTLRSIYLLCCGDAGEPLRKSAFTSCVARSVILRAIDSSLDGIEAEDAELLTEIAWEALEPVISSTFSEPIVSFSSFSRFATAALDRRLEFDSSDDPLECVAGDICRELLHSLRADLLSKQSLRSSKSRTSQDNGDSYSSKSKSDTSTKGGKERAKARSESSSPHKNARVSNAVTPRMASQRGHTGVVALRLYHDAKERSRRLQNLQEVARQQEDEECTFAPDLSESARSSRALSVVARRRPPSMQASSEERELREKCTFRPELVSKPGCGRSSSTPAGFSKTVGRLRAAADERERMRILTEEKPYSTEGYEASRRKSTKPFNLSSKVSVPLLYVDVNIGNGRRGRIGVHEGDSPGMLAKTFASKHLLERKLQQRLEKILRRHMLGEGGSNDGDSIALEPQELEPDSSGANEHVQTEELSDQRDQSDSIGHTTNVEISIDNTSHSTILDIVEDSEYDELFKGASLTSEQYDYSDNEQLESEAVSC